MEDILAGNRHKTEKYDTNKVNKLSSLICSNSKLLLVISKIVSYFTNQEKVKEEKDRFNLVLKLEAKKRKIGKDIITDFGKMWSEMTDKEIGFVLEDLIMKIGCFDESRERPETLRDFMIYNISSIKDIKEGNYNKKNFDVLFCEQVTNKYDSELNKQIILLNGDVEFHECKKNISNCIPVSIEEEIDIEDKLDFMKQVYNWMIESNKYETDNRFFIPTFTYNIDPQQEHLLKKGFGFIKIISLKMIIDKCLKE